MPMSTVAAPNAAQRALFDNKGFKSGVTGTFTGKITGGAAAQNYKIIYFHTKHPLFGKKQIDVFKVSAKLLQEGGSRCTVDCPVIVGK